MSKKNMSRRAFLKSAGVVGTGSLLAASGALAEAADETSPKKPQTTRVPTRAFGKTGVSVSSLALGGMFDIMSNHLLLKQALKWGVNYWDTADCYEGGNSEVGIGQFFQKYPDTREKIFLVTKSDNRDPEGLTKLLNRSLERLNTKYIDLYFVHGIKDISELNNDTKAWAEKAKSEGRIKFFGFSVHKNMEDCMLAASKLGWIDGIMAAYNFRIMHGEKMKSAVKACSDAGIGLTAMKTQGGGSVSVESETELEMAGRFLKQGFTDKQAKLKAVWANPNIASICSQMPNMTVLMSNVAAALDQTKLSAEDSGLLMRYAEETAAGYCAGCAQICEEAIGGKAPVCDVLRYLMYYRSYGEQDMARRLYAEIPSEVRGHLDSLDFSIAEGRCPQRLQIGRIMKEAAVLLA
jgi:predicted aldo/keto reductase-like oxidoreductase